MVKKGLLAAVVLCLAPVSVSAQSVMAEYAAYIGPQDMVNSSGQRLSGLCVMVQQDRANYHRFNRRDGADGFDPVFADRTLRGRIVNTCELTQSGRNIDAHVRKGNPVFVSVRVLDDGGQMRVIVSELAG